MSDNILIAYEILHLLKKKNREIWGILLLNWT